MYDFTNLDDICDIASEDGQHFYLARRCSEHRGAAYCYILGYPQRGQIKKHIQSCEKLTALFGGEETLVAFAHTLVSDDIGDLASSGVTVGDDTEAWLVAAAQYAKAMAGEVICAWGRVGAINEQDTRVLAWLHDANIRPTCLGISRDGTPTSVLALPKGFDTLAFYDGRPEFDSYGDF